MNKIIYIVPLLLIAASCSKNKINSENNTDPNLLVSIHLKEFNKFYERYHSLNINQAKIELEDYIKINKNYLNKADKNVRNFYLIGLALGYGRLSVIDNIQGNIQEANNNLEEAIKYQRENRVFDKLPNMEDDQLKYEVLEAVLYLDKDNVSWLNESIITKILEQYKPRD